METFVFFILCLLYGSSMLLEVRSHSVMQTPRSSRWIRPPWGCLSWHYPIWVSWQTCNLSHLGRERGRNERESCFFEVRKLATKTESSRKTNRSILLGLQASQAECLPNFVQDCSFVPGHGVFFISHFSITTYTTYLPLFVHFELAMSI